jgi:hypothetical protein
MADTPLSRSTILTTFADNVTGQISSSDLRNFTVTVMQPEFLGAYDFWNTPTSDNITTDLTTRGTHIYSQIAGQHHSLSFGKIYCLTTSNSWSTAIASTSANNFILGVATDSYASGATNVEILLKGIVYDSSLATRLSGYIGRPLYLFSATSCSMSVTNADGHSRVVGYVLPNAVGSVQTKGKWFFNPTIGWAVTGV